MQIQPATEAKLKAKNRVKELTSALIDKHGEDINESIEFSAKNGDSYTRILFNDLDWVELSMIASHIGSLGYRVDHNITSKDIFIHWD